MTRRDRPIISAVAVAAIHTAEIKKTSMRGSGDNSGIGVLSSVDQPSVRPSMNRPTVSVVGRAEEVVEGRATAVVNTRYAASENPIVVRSR